ncbi:efflux RND transporter periplasmic adaptor subunit [Autumnicola edwardsiae]|uniref:Efflux RND transporter periplasmic adaptor subunit n=1 Tax=Autumnicola edwardsiae TaxID=3075594 RepID=A0ABU3CUU8_9FLAO|nr:efflux RND transporter periplasmic adaptor subunit [Zunongwangia sp. F297]MDT0650120.1 efflux RND transporter periplasmic adaptor subunit [Zunongwangia sp. F297]
MKTKKIIFICAGILLVGAAVTAFIFMSEPTASSEGATREMAMLVEVVEVENGNFTPTIEATGTVRPVEDVLLSALVGGQIVRRSPAFVPGGFVTKGTILLQIDPSDYRNTLELRKSELRQRETDLAVEMGRQEVAQQDLNLIGGDSLSSEESSLVLRQPQLNAVKATIQAAEAAVDQAQLNLNRTTIRAPFDAHILSQNVSVGSQVAPGDDLGRLVGSENYWVELTVPVAKLQYLHFPSSEEEKGSTVKVRNTTAWQSGVFRIGYLDKQVGALDAQTRLARILVRVPDPLGRQGEAENKPELMIGSFVQAQVQGEEIQNVVRLNRDYIRSNQTVWVMEDEKLSIREVEIVLSDAEYAYISNGLSAQENVVTSNLSTVVEDTPLRTGTNKGTANGEEQGSEE